MKLIILMLTILLTGCHVNPEPALDSLSLLKIAATIAALLGVISLHFQIFRKRCYEGSNEPN